MVLESIINPFTAEKRPWEMFFIGFIYASVAILLSLWIFKSHASLVMIFFTVFASIPVVFSVIKLEEEKDLAIASEKTLLKEHSKALSFFMFLFLGFTTAFTLWYVFLPASVSSSLFSIQTETITAVNSKISGNIVNNLGIVSKIFFNNLKVLVFCILFAFIYGFGAIFILTWNASVIGAAMGNFIRANLGNAPSIASYFHIGSLGILRYAVHGIPEIAAYFIAGLAGAIISIAVVRHDFKSDRFEHVLLDSAELILLSVIVLVSAAFLEVFVTPVLF